MSNIISDRDAYILAIKYGLWPEETLKYEMKHGTGEPNWTVFANRTNEIDILVKFNSFELDQEP